MDEDDDYEKRLKELIDRESKLPNGKLRSNSTHRERALTEALAEYRTFKRQQP